jgi:hypothetical protein
VEELANTGNPAITPVEASRGRYGGTYVVDDLALTYAMWVSPRGGALLTSCASR